MATKKGKHEKEQALELRPGGAMAGPWDEMERLFGDFFRRGWLRPFDMEWPRQFELAAPFEGRTPRVDMLDREAEVVVRAELPGVGKDELDVTVSGHSVTIRAETKHEKKKEEEKYYRHEMSRGEFQRTLALPVTVDESKARATFSDGVLELTLPKMEKARQRKVKVE
ncbi:MAG: Hsp20/alpha crystallin family protein [Gammaproteobacteria bacterium]|jgi:HSP20 family protein